MKLKTGESDLREKLYDSSLRFLSYRMRSEKEIKDYLTSKIFSPDEKTTVIISQIIHKLKKLGLINDWEFSCFWIEKRLAYNPRSAKIIKMELARKGIKKEIAEKAIARKIPSLKEQDVLLSLARKKIPRYRKLPKFLIYEKLGRYLAYRGFDWEEIKNAIDTLCQKE